MLREGIRAWTGRGTGLAPPALCGPCGDKRTQSAELQTHSTGLAEDQAQAEETAGLLLLSSNEVRPKLPSGKALPQFLMLHDEMWRSMSRMLFYDRHGQSSEYFGGHLEEAWMESNNM